MSDILEGFLVCFATIFAVVGLAILMVFFVDTTIERHDSKLWNNGYCDCGGRWEYEQAVGHKSTTSYIYVCDKCGNRIEISEMR